VEIAFSDEADSNHETKVVCPYGTNAKANTITDKLEYSHLYFYSVYLHQPPTSLFHRSISLICFVPWSALPSMSRVFPGPRSQSLNNDHELAFLLDFFQYFDFMFPSFTTLPLFLPMFTISFHLNHWTALFLSPTINHV